MLYQLHELQRALLAPTAHLAQAGASMFSSPGSWLAALPGSSQVAATYELLYRLSKDFPKPKFDIHAVRAHGAELPVVEQTVMRKPFCRLLRFNRYADDAKLFAALEQSPTVLVVAPLSGHHATLLRDTVRSLLADHDVYITDWIDARLVPADEGAFALDDYVAYIRDFIHRIGAERLHVIAVCQPTVPVLAAAALMAAAGEQLPRSMALISGPIDARIRPTRVNELATTHPLQWFEHRLVHRVPAGYPGWRRRVYPGFLQLSAFIAMNPDRHAGSHSEFFRQLVRGDHAGAQAHRAFYDDYNAVLDMPAEYYLDCVRIVFQEFLLPRGLWHVGGERVAPEALTTPALMTIEGDRDDISGLGQTRAAHALCTGIADDRKRHLTVEGAGHYGTFSGHRWREFVYPRLRDFIRDADTMTR